MFIQTLQKNRGLTILLITNSIVLLAAGMLGPIAALFVQRVGGDLLDASLAGGIFAVAAGITVLLSGSLSDAVKENELVVVAGYVLMAVGFFAYLLVDSVVKLLLVQVAIGVGEALYSPSFDALYSKFLDKGRSGSEWGLWEAMNYFTLTGGAVLGGLIVSKLGFDWLFIVMGCITLSSALYILFLPRKAL